MRQYKGNSLIDFPDSYTVIDIETTGLDPTVDSIIELAAIRIENGNLSDTYSSLVNPGFPISQFISQLTGITNEELENAPFLKDILIDFYNFLGNSILVGHNIHFDINFLYDNIERETGRFLSNDFIDTLRLSKSFIKQAPSYKLIDLAAFFKIPVTVSHRALSDCELTNELFKQLLLLSQTCTEKEQELLNALTYDESIPFYGKKIVVKGLPQYYSFNFMREVSKKCHATMTDIFYSSCDYIVFSKYTYQRYKRGEYSEKFEKANRLSTEGKLTILSEDEWCQLMNLPIPTLSTKTVVKAKSISTANIDFDETHPLYGKLCVFTGTLDKMTRKEAMQLVVDVGGLVGDSVTKKTNYLILGNNDYCPTIKDGKSAKQKKAETLKLSGQDIDIISENVFYDMIAE